ncbi:MAG TPA: PqqD family protein [Gemmatimonadaceae bacterium]|nr:PqqD family protein [Gemmatimonadaceae bacterium]
MVPLGWDAQVVASAEQVSCDLGSELVVLDLRAGIYYGLTDDGGATSVGARIWTLLQERRSLGEIRDQLLLEFDVDADRCEADLLALITDLAQRSLVVVSHASPA